MSDALAETLVPARYDRARNVFEDDLFSRGIDIVKNDSERMIDGVADAGDASIDHGARVVPLENARDFGVGDKRAKRGTGV